MGSSCRLQECPGKEKMKFRQIVVKNFRCLKDIVVPVSDSTVLLGDNNTGKVALLDALRLVPFNPPNYFGG